MRDVARGFAYATGLFFTCFLLVVYADLQDEGPGLGMDDEKMSAEESGYYDQFSDAYELGSGYARDLAQAVDESKRYKGRATDEEKSDYEDAVETKAEKFRDLKILAIDYLQKLNSTTPPKAMESLHQQFVRLLRHASRQNDPSEIADECERFYESTVKFTQKIASRSTVPDLPSPLNIVYNPPLSISPGIPLVGDSGFEVGVSSPVGGFSLSSSQVGVSQLILIERGRSRYFKLDREFEITLYSPRNVRIKSNMNEKTLTVQIGGT